MVVSVPITTALTIQNQDGRFSFRNLKHSSDNDDLLKFGVAVNSLQFGAPAEKYLRTTRTELRNEQ
jgi:hypothetical protein